MKPLLPYFSLLVLLGNTSLPAQTNSLTPDVIKACKDAHILISEVPNNRDRGYEIVLGGYDNKNSDIRKNGQRVAHMGTPQLLSCDSFRRYVGLY